MLSLSEVVKVTIAIAGHSDAFLPTVIDFDRDGVRVLDGVRDDIDQTDAVRDWLPTLDVRGITVTVHLI